MRSLSFVIAALVVLGDFFIDVDSVRGQTFGGNYRNDGMSIPGGYAPGPYGGALFSSPAFTHDPTFGVANFTHPGMNNASFGAAAYGNPGFNNNGGFDYSEAGHSGYGGTDMHPSTFVDANFDHYGFVHSGFANNELYAANFVNSGFTAANFHSANFGINRHQSMTTVGFAPAPFQGPMVGNFFGATSPVAKPTSSTYRGATEKPAHTYASPYFPSSPSHSPSYSPTSHPAAVPHGRSF